MTDVNDVVHAYTKPESTPDPQIAEMPAATYLVASLCSLTLGYGSRTASHGSTIVGNAFLPLGNVGDNAAFYSLVGVLLGLGGRTSLYWIRLTSELVLLLGDVGDLLGIELAGSHS